MKPNVEHIKLLDYLREHEEYWTSLRATRWAKVPAFNALRAVVELHKPVINALPDETCLACQDFYPCPTIQEIESHLK